MAIDKRITAAARIYGCKGSELMKVRFVDDGSVVIIAPTGQKFIYSAEQIAEATPKRRAPAKPKASKNPRKK
jgi:hypothetical protein